jgi:hypothetical protein
MSERMSLRGLGPHEVEGLARLREALALVSEAELAFGHSDYHPQPFYRIRERA